MEKLLGQIALITGASRKFGFELCKSLVKEGLTVIAVDKRIEPLKNLSISPQMLSGKGKLYPIKCDISSKRDVNMLVNEINSSYGACKLVINTDGVMKYVSRVDVSTYKSVLQKSVYRPLMFTQEVVKFMEEAKVNGVIIHVAGLLELGPRPRKPSFAGLVIYNECISETITTTNIMRKALQEEKSSIKLTVMYPNRCLSNMVEIAFLKKSLPFLRQAEHHFKPEDFSSSVIHALKSVQMDDIPNILLGPKDSQDGLCRISDQFYVSRWKSGDYERAKKFPEYSF